MTYKYRLVQRFDTGFKEEFLELERMFADLEAETPGFPKGKRFLSYSGKEPSNTLIWEVESESLDGLMSILESINMNIRHKELFNRQKHYLCDVFGEIYQSF